MALKRIQAKDHDRSRSIGFFVVAAIEFFMRHGAGSIEGERVSLVDEVATFVVDAYALDKDGRRLYDSAFFSRPKGFAKSELAAFIAIVEALLPCRFDRWAQGGEVYEFLGFRYEFAPGEPIPRQVKSPVIRCMATEEGQSGEVYNTVYLNLQPGSGNPLSQLFKPDDVGLSRIKIPGGGVIMKSTASSKSKDGGKETFVTFDETHLYVGTELKAMYKTVKRNLDKRRLDEPWALETSTMFAPGEESVAEDTYQLALIVDEGRSAASQVGLLFDHREGKANTDFTSERDVLESLTEAYGDFADIVDVKRIYRNNFVNINTSISDAKRYFLNQITGSVDAWIDFGQWTSCEMSHEDYANDPVKAGDMIVLGFDGSEGRVKKSEVADATALVAIRVRDGLTWEVAVWEQPEGPRGKNWKVPRDEVDEVVKATFETYDVIGFYADPAYWETEIALWEERYGKRLLVKSTLKHPIRKPVGGNINATAMYQAYEMFKHAVIQGDMSHFGSPVLSRHIRNARVVKKAYGYKIEKESPSSDKKIDAAFAAVLAWQARIAALSIVGSGVKIAHPTRMPFRIR